MRRGRGRRFDDEPKLNMKKVIATALAFIVIILVISSIIMILKKNFVTQDVGDSQVMVSTGRTDFNGMVKSNKTAAFIINCLKTDTTKDEIVNKMLEKYDASEEVISRDVDKVLESLRKIGAIEE